MFKAKMKSSTNTQPTRLEAYQLLHNGILAFSRAEQAGMRVDVEYCKRKQAHLKRKIERANRKFEESKLAQYWQKTFGNKYNNNSNWQFAEILYRKKRIPLPNGNPPNENPRAQAGPVDQEALRAIAAKQPEINYILDVRKLQNTHDFLGRFLREQVREYIHPFLNLHTVRTYRPSTDSPNLANVPKRDKWMMNVVRKALYPRPGHRLLEVDFSGIEVMIAACLHKDPNMLKYIKDPKSDMHGDVAKQIFMLSKYDKEIQKKGLKAIPEFKYFRDATKNSFIFPQFYGDYYKNNADSFCEWLKLPIGKFKKGDGVGMPDGTTIADHLIKKRIASHTDFVEHLRQIEDDFWGRRFKVYSQCKDKWVREYQRKGHFDLVTGFRCSGVMRKNEVINYRIQGPAFHCLLWCFIEIDRISREENWDSRLINQVYDSMVVDAHPDELEHVAKTIHNVATIELPKAWPWIIVPLEIEADVCGVDEPWSEKKAFKLS